MSDVLERIPQMSEEELVKLLVLAIKYSVDSQRLAIVARAIIEELERRGVHTSCSQTNSSQNH
jgi:phage gp16-like protein